MSWMNNTQWTTHFVEELSTNPKRQELQSICVWVKTCMSQTPNRLASWSPPEAACQEAGGSSQKQIKHRPTTSLPDTKRLGTAYTKQGYAFGPIGWCLFMFL